MTEVAGQCAVYLDVSDIQGAAAAIAEAWDRRDFLIGCGFENAKRYTTETMIADYLDAYRAIFRSNHRSVPT
jgi:hypothetical protein